MFGGEQDSWRIKEDVHFLVLEPYLVWTLLSLLNRLALFRTVNSHADRLTVCSTKSSHTTQSTTPAENVVNRQVPGAVCRL